MCPIHHKQDFNTINKPKVDPKKKLDDLLTRFLGNRDDTEQAEKDAAKNTDVEMDTDEDNK